MFEDHVVVDWMADQENLQTDHACLQGGKCWGHHGLADCCLGYQDWKSGLWVKTEVFQICAVENLEWVVVEALLDLVG